MLGKMLRFREPFRRKAPVMEADAGEVTAEATDSILTQAGDEVNESEENKEATESPPVSMVEVTEFEQVSAVNEAGGEAEEKPEAAPEAEGGDSLMANLFAQAEQKEETPLDSLIASLPDVTIEELLDELDEIKVIMRGWQ